MQGMVKNYIDISTFVLFSLARVEDVCWMPPDEISLGKKLLRRGVSTGEQPLGCRDYLW